MIRLRVRLAWSIDLPAWMAVTKEGHPRRWVGGRRVMAGPTRAIVRSSAFTPQAFRVIDEGGRSAVMEMQERRLAPIALAAKTR